LPPSLLKKEQRKSETLLQSSVERKKDEAEKRGIKRKGADSLGELKMEGKNCRPLFSKHRAAERELKKAGLFVGRWKGLEGIAVDLIGGKDWKTAMPAPGRKGSTGWKKKTLVWETAERGGSFFKTTS